jgi:uncharacterized Rossmann fold enzyme
MDRQWWDKYIKQVRLQFAGVIYSALDGCYETRKTPANHYGNSGAGAIAMAAKLGAKKIILLGYDCQHTGGKTHWHGSHPKGLPDAGKVQTWPKKFAELAKDICDVRVLNCSRETALQCWPRAQLADVLSETNLQADAA